MSRPTRYRIQVYDTHGSPKQDEIIEVVQSDRNLVCLSDEDGIAWFALDEPGPLTLLVNGRVVLRRLDHPSVIVFADADPPASRVH